MTAERNFGLVQSTSKLSKILFSICVFGFLFLCSILPVFAEDVGVSITPALIDETLDPGSEMKFTLKIENLNSAEQKFYLFTRNISGTNNGVPIFADSNLEKTGYELADWIKLPLSELVLGPNQSQSIDFIISVPPDAPPGGHFGGIFVSVDAPQIESSGAAVGYQVANIIDIRVNGDIKESGEIRQFSTSRFLYGSQNVTFGVRIQNTGNVLIRPTGPLEVRNMLGNIVGNVMFNTSQFGVFPGETKDFMDIEWKGDSIGFGRYEAILSPGYGDYGSKKTMSSTVSFWILPMNIIGPALGALLVIILLVFVFVKMYIKRSLSHLYQGRSVIRRNRKGSSSATLLIIVVSLTVTGLFLIVLLALFA
jgi:hypothetical protein